MTTKILKTNTENYEVSKNENGTLDIFISPGVKFRGAGHLIINIGGIEAVLSRCIDFEGSFQEYIENQARERKEKSDRSMKERSEKLDQLWSEAKNPDKSAKEMYDLFSQINHLEDPKNSGWFTVDFFFLGENNLSKTILKNICEKTGGDSFTVTPYDNGAVILKSNGKSFSNNRNFAKAGFISDLLD